MVDYAEKRDFQRMVVDCSFEYQLAGDQGKHQGTVRNLSAKGVSFVSSNPVHVGASMSMTLTPENDITPPLSAEVTITRCDSDESGNYLIAGEINRLL